MQPWLKMLDTQTRRGDNPAMRILSIACQKGGVGKTTSAINLSFGLAAIGRRVLLIDTDPQASLSLAVGINPEQDNLKDVLGGAKPGRLPMGAIIKPLAEGIDLAAPGFDLAGCELDLGQRIGREGVLKRAMATVTSYDIAIIDTPPSFGLLVLNALAASDAVIAPVTPDPLGLRGLALFWENLGRIKGELNPGLVVLGCLVCQYDRRSTLHRASLEHLRAEKLPVLAVIKKSIQAARSAGQGKPITASGELKDQYLQLTQEVDKWLKSKTTRQP
jgi:chromosome partitioning protein